MLQMIMQLKRLHMTIPYSKPSSEVFSCALNTWFFPLKCTSTHNSVSFNNKVCSYIWHLFYEDVEMEIVSQINNTDKY